MITSCGFKGYGCGIQLHSSSMNESIQEIEKRVKPQLVDIRVFAKFFTVSIIYLYIFCFI